ncbi:MAG: ECF transporter S component [Oscillospiraceae bacterium]|nr:ECF transporter S component [Oscillospiraceae bacterium]
MTGTMTKERKTLYRIITIGLMAALVYAGNYLQIKIPNGVLVTRIHLGNSMCLLAGLLFGSVNGGLASGIGAMLYDLFDPVYIVSAPYTFISKFAMGFTAGALRNSNEKARVFIAAVTGQIVYILLYLLKSFFTIIILGGTVEAAWAAVGTNAITSVINGVLAVVIAVPLYFTLRRALKQTMIFSLIAENDKENRPEKKTKPVVMAVIAVAVAVVIGLSLRLSAENKLKEQRAQEASISASAET